MGYNSEFYPTMQLILPICEIIATPNFFCTFISSHLTHLKFYLYDHKSSVNHIHLGLL